MSEERVLVKFKRCIVCCIGKYGGIGHSNSIGRWMSMEREAVQEDASGRHQRIARSDGEGQLE